LLLADFANVPACVRHEAARQIAAAVHHQHFQHGYICAMRIDESHVGLTRFRLDDDRLEILEVARILQLRFQIRHGNAQTIGDGGQTLFHLRGIIAKKKDAEGWIIVDQNAAIAVEHAPARRDYGNGAYAVALSPLQEFVGIDDLKLPETYEQHADHPYDDVGDDGQPLLRQSIVVAKPVRHENPARESFIGGC